MSFEDKIQSAYGTFSKSFARLADFVLDSYVETSFMTATELGHVVNVDATTVVRFSQELGYSGYPELLRDIRSRVKDQLLVQPDKTQEEEDIRGVLSTAMRELENVFQQTQKLIDPNALASIVDHIGSSDRVVIIPDAPGLPAAYSLVDILERGGFRVSLIRSGAIDLARTVQRAKKNDLLIAIEVERGVDFIARALKEATERGLATAAISGAASLPSALAATDVLVAQSQPTRELGMMLVGAIVFALGQALRWRYPQRYAGIDREILDIVNRIQIRKD